LRRYWQKVEWRFAPTSFVLIWQSEFGARRIVKLNTQNVAAPRLLSERQRASPTKKKAGREGAAAPSRIKVKLQIDLPVGSRIGPGKIQLIELIETEGSLARATQAMGISYRRGWLFVQQINAAFDEPVIATPEHGHGGSASKLTAFGQELIRRYRRLESVAEAHGDADLSWLAAHQRQE